MTFEEHVDQSLKKVKKLLVAKHHDYGDGNLDKYGFLGIVIRMSDKLARLENLMFKEHLVNECIDDTILDLIGYAIQIDIRLEGYNGEEKESCTRLLFKQSDRSGCQDKV